MKLTDKAILRMVSDSPGRNTSEPIGGPDKKIDPRGRAHQLDKRIALAKTLLENPNISRIEVARQLGISKPTLCCLASNWRKPQRTLSASAVRSLRTSFVPFVSRTKYMAVPSCFRATPSRKLPRQIDTAKGDCIRADVRNRTSSAAT